MPTQVVNWPCQPFVRPFSPIPDDIFLDPNDTEDNYFFSAAKSICICRSWLTSSWVSFWCQKSVFLKNLFGADDLILY